MQYMRNKSYANKFSQKLEIVTYKKSWLYHNQSSILFVHLDDGKSKVGGGVANGKTSQLSHQQFYPFFFSE